MLCLLLSGCWRTLHYRDGERALTVVCWPEPTCVDFEGCAEIRCKASF